MEGGMETATADYELAGREIEGARAGDAEMLGHLLESCRDYLEAIAGRGLGRDLVPKVGASDLVQETLLGASRDFARFEGRSRDELLAWLRAILQNRLAVIRRHYRGTHKRRVTREVAAGDPTAGGPWEAWRSAATPPGTHAERREGEAALRSALGRLSEDHRRVVVWHQYDGLTFEEIGQRLDRSAEAARKLWSRALTRLADELGPTHAPG
jgi:RNA polymerase sigma-70 factor (ECF subfamily)